MNTELQPVCDLLTGKLHWLPALLVWVGALKTLFHFIGNRLTGWTAAVLVRTVHSPDPTDAHLLLTILDSRNYQRLHFMLALFSLPLPTRADYDAALAATTSATGNKPSAPPPATQGTLLLLALALLAGVTGCADIGARAFATEQLTADAATTATSTFNLYYHTATNGADAGELARLESARSQLYTADHDLAAALSVVEGLRAAYVTNSASTNAAALNFAVTAAQAQSSNVVTLVKLFLNPTTK